MNAIGKRRLLKLAEHLETGKLGHEKFDFQVLNSFYGEERVPHSCGTNGCALGECPIVFPRYWKFDYSGQPVLQGLEDAFDSAIKFFQINKDESNGLFAPAKTRPWAPGKILRSNAKRKQVARSIRQFVICKEAQA